MNKHAARQAPTASDHAGLDHTTSHKVSDALLVLAPVTEQFSVRQGAFRPIWVARWRSLARTPVSHLTLTLLPSEPSSGLLPVCRTFLEHSTRARMHTRKAYARE